MSANRHVDPTAAAHPVGGQESRNPHNAMTCLDETRREASQLFWTALKFSIGRYLEAAVGNDGNYSSLQPVQRMVDQCHPVVDRCQRQLTPDCDLNNGLAQDLRTSGGGFLRRVERSNFGKNVYSLWSDEQILKGWGVRPSDWMITASVQHELLPRVSLSVGYTRRWLQNFTVTDNLATTAADYTPFSVGTTESAAPGRRGLRRIRPVRRDACEVQHRRQLSDLRAQLRDHLRDTQAVVEINLAARLGRGFQFQAGSVTGQRVTQAAEQFPELKLKSQFSFPGECLSFNVSPEITEITENSQGFRSVHSVRSVVISN